MSEFQWIYILVCLGCLSRLVFCQCPTSWIRNEGSCYHFSHDLENWPSAMVICRSVDAYLVEINSEVENNFILKHGNVTCNGLKNGNCLRISDSSYWIGLSDLETEGTWKWMHSQTDPIYTKWSPNEPNNAASNENCGMIRTKEMDWNDYVCQNGQHYICEKTLEDIEVIG